MTREGDRPLSRNKRWGKAAVTEPMTESLCLFSNSSVTGESGSGGGVAETLTCFRTARLLVKAAVVEESQNLSPVFERLGYW
ncbi:hypothetical protein M1B74_08535 [Bacteroides pyogenes]|uniref:hypothetical protein n=1 Tax=Bacteroides pyogenes TaxID=310300 RepID=UPI003B431A53